MTQQLSLFFSLSVCRRSSLLKGGVGGGGEGGREVKAYVCEKAWPTINHSILSVTAALPGIHKLSGKIIIFPLSEVPPSPGPRVLSVCSIV
jgi:hypothetical protein